MLRKAAQDPAYDDPRFAEIETAIPHRRLEAWKWTDVRRALGAKPEGLSAALTPEFRDGASEPADVQVTQAQVSDVHPMNAVFEAFGQDAYKVVIPAGADGGTLTVSSLERGNGAVRVELGAGAKLKLVELHEGEADTFINADFEIDLAEGAELSRILIQDDAATTVRIATATITLAEGAKLKQHILATGAALSRLETHIRVEGEGVEVEANGAYLLEGSRHADLTTLVVLNAPDATIRQTVRGVVTDKARGVFQGKFLVQREAQHTDAEMRHDALMLSDRSEVRAKPELEIYADDVACAHGNTIGQLDESALFYMRQRGIPEAEARALLVEAFVASAFDGSGESEQLSRRVRDWLDGVT